MIISMEQLEKMLMNQKIVLTPQAEKYRYNNVKTLSVDYIKILCNNKHIFLSNYKFLFSAPQNKDSFWII